MQVDRRSNHVSRRGATDGARNGAAKKTGPLPIGALLAAQLALRLVSLCMYTAIGVSLFGFG